MRLLNILLCVAATFALISAPHMRANSSEPVIQRLDGSKLAPKQIDAEVERLMTKGRVPGLALALIQNGKPVYVKSYGLRSVEKNQPLETDTVMYGASLTKLIFAYFVMQLVDEGKINLDQPISAYLKKPLPDYPKYADLAGDPRWRSLTARMLLDHTPGFPNFRFLNPDGKLDFKFDPGTRYAYSGEGINLLQFVLEEGLGLDVGKEMQRRIFDRFGMTRTSMTWREDFAPNLADGYDVNGKLERHHARSNVRAAGSMDTTITDYAKFLAAFISGEGLSAVSRREMLRPQIAIASAHQFPTLDATTERANRKIGLSAGLGSVLFKSPYGAAFFKGGHDDWTGNMVVCVESKKQCILLLSNSVRGEVIYPALVKSVFGDTRLPWSWEYNPQGSPPPIY
ncbi:MAG TPA: serine hydrolase domain-containing protein [Blastocatellia bacterium]|nr:serine hydrolase domain-containing protein [Blastocatellia bacterium]